MPSQRNQARPLVAVVGAGVTGLTTALLLQCNGYDVTIIASEFPKDGYHPEYTSTKAGAHWRTLCGEDDTRAKEYDSLTYKTFYELAENPNSGIKVRDAIDYYDFNPSGQEGRAPWWSKVVHDFKVIDSTTPNFPIAYSYKTPVVTPSIYLNFLLQEFKKAGGRIQQRTLTHVAEAAHWVGTRPSPVKIIVNCTGYRARYLGAKTGPIMYVIPRSNGEVVLGGSHEAYQNDPTVSATKTTHILKTIVERYPKILTPGTSAAYAASPDLLSKFDIVDQRVGFRPSRIGGVRVDVEHGRKFIFHELH
ncbi:hypothetical protein BGW38_002344 [Lunasporangiospora selenospora]|uniref:FAD dependent oxidoreductase domain-containing protein n=1 Tax=Lunasporangiospora selenospora TaxID=979761 RepID=A0A9P6FT00_9FUNG|nr:hypothetical protein BGW38_002344 [Lunasporangiospora selenospora]